MNKGRGGWGKSTGKEKRDERSHTAFYAGTQINNATIATTMRIFIYIFVIGTVLQNKRDKKRDNIPNSYSPIVDITN